MKNGWKCPNCGKAHGPHVDTCPEGSKDKSVKPFDGTIPVPPYVPNLPNPWPEIYPKKWWWDYPVTCGGEKQ